MFNDLNLILSSSTHLSCLTGSPDPGDIQPELECFFYKLLEKDSNVYAFELTFLLLILIISCKIELSFLS